LVALLWEPNPERHPPAGRPTSSHDAGKTNGFFSGDYNEFPFPFSFSFLLAAGQKGRAGLSAVERARHNEGQKYGQNQVLPVRCE